MISLSAKIRKNVGKKVKELRDKEILPAVLYGPEVKNLNLELDLKEFEKVYKEAGESSLVSLNIEGEKENFQVLIYEIQYDPLTDRPFHVDFYQPRLGEEVEATVPIILEGEAPAVKDLKGTLVTHISEVTVKAKPRDLPKEIKVNVEGLKTFDDAILISDLEVSEKIKILKEKKEIVASVSPPEKVEEELEKTIEEKVEEVEKVKKEEKEPSAPKDTGGKRGKEPEKKGSQ
jgi:large subunit ribosomal protein L25